MNHPSDDPSTCCPTCGGDGTIDPFDALQIGSAVADNQELLAKVKADAQALADVRTLDAADAWIEKHFADETHTSWSWRICSPRYAIPLSCHDATPDEARAKAAAWVREQTR